MHRRDRDQLLERGPGGRKVDLVALAEGVGAGAPVPEPRRFLRVLDLGARAQIPVCGRGGEQPFGVEGAVEGGQLDEPERPEKRPEAFGLPDRIDHRRIVGLGGQGADGGRERAGESADTIVDLPAVPELAARHRLEARRSSGRP